jgi:DsbC/DsbD-like thiol-disulfide interchange protein/cytochrome c biogenesis protein CcdA
MKWLVALLFVVASLASSSPAMALESAPVSSARTVASLVTDTDAMRPGTPFRVALRLRLADGWHTYWKNPGDAGVAPELTLELPDGTTQSPIDWPTPRRVQEGPVMTYAYTGDVLLPVTLTTRGDAPATIRAHAQWLVCKDICVPEEADFSLTLPLGLPAPSSQAPLFVAHDRTVPRPSPWAAHIAPDGTLFVQGPELTSATVTDAWFIPEQPNRIQDDAAQPLSVRDGGFTLALRPAAGFDAVKPLGGVLSVRDRAGMQADVAVSAVPGPAPPPAMPPLSHVLVFAFLGGLILNLMPCVFPILAMKAVALARNAGRGRAHAMAYTAGVLVMFVGLAGSGLADRHGAVGSFFTGLLAVLVATPCTAPFMAVAVAAGLAAPPAVTVLVFAVMGLGLASPYIALAELPGLVRVIPRPGRWMEVMKQALAFPMYGAAAWLLWVVSEEAGSVGVLVTATGAVLVGFAAWILGLGQTSSIHAGSSQSGSGTGQTKRSHRVRHFGQIAAAVAVLVAGAALSGIEASGAPGASVQPDSGGAEAFTPARLAALRAQGRPVFVNMTAAWCVTCLVNERVAIATGPVQRAFAAADVAYLKGDWTRQDPAITAFLQQNGRDGVPLYVFYPAHAAQPQILPQILTEGEVLRRLRPS